MLLRWTVPPQSDISGYRVYSGAASQTYNSPIDTGLLPAATLNGVVYYLYRNLQLATPYYVAVTAYNTSAMESDYSNEKLWNLSAATPPPVNAGPDLSGSVGQLFTLGSASQLGVSYYWEQTAGTPVSLSSRTASSTQFSSATAGTFQFTLTAYDTQGVAAQDVVNVIVTAPATSTPTATRTPTPSATRTPTPSVTATRTLTPSPSRTPTTALTTTATPTRTLTPSVTATRTLTPSPSKTPTPVASPTPTPSRTSTATSTPSSTATRTPTSALSPTPTLSPRPTLTSTETPTYTPTAIPTDTPSPTLSPTPSPPPICATILPNGLGALMPQNERTGCTDGWQCLRSDDADVSYVFSQSTTAIGPRSDIYALDDMGPQDGVVASVTVRIMSRSLVAGSGSSATPLLKVNGNSQLFEGLPLATSTDYQEAETSFIVNPARNQSWTWADIDGLQAGVRHQVGPSDEVRTTSVSVLVCFVPTGPTRTPTSTATATPTATTTDTSTVTPTITDTPMRTATASATATATAVQTATPTNTSTPTSTPTFTATVTMTPSKTATPTGTLTPSVTATWTLTPSPTRTSTASLAPTLTATSTRTPTADPTVTCTATLSPTTTPTQTSTATPTATRTATQVLTATPTATWTGTATLTATAPPLPTKTPTLTPTGSSTATLSPTPTPSRTSTATSTPSATATRTPTSALVPTPTLTPSPTPTTITTATPSPAPSLTPQPSPICATLLPNGPGAFVPENQGSGCTDGWQCLRSEDGDGSYVFSPIATTFALRSDIYALDDMGPQDGVVTSVTIRIISRSLIGGSGSSAVPLLKVNGSSQLFDGPPLATSTEYQEAESTYVKNPAWNQSWTWADMDGLQAGVRHQVAATDEVRTTSVSALVCFLPTGPTSTPTPTRTATPIPTITPTRSATPSTTSTPTPTPSYSPTSTPTAKPTDTRTPTFAPSLTVTPTPSFTATATSTVSPTASATSTFTAAPTHTPEPSATPTGTATATVTSTATPSPPPTVTPTDTATPPPSVTPTPTVPTETPTPAATETPTSTATRTPTATPTPLPNDGLASLLGITMRGSHGSMFSVQHVSQSASGGSGAEDQPELSVQTDGVLAAGAFPSEGVRGAKDLVIWKANNAALPPSSMLEVYRLESDRPPQRLTYTELSGPAGPAVDPTVLSGDVDPSSVGNEIVVVGGDSAGRSARVCVFGGMVDEQLHLLSDFYMPRRAVGDKPSVPAIGHVLPDSRYAGAEIIIGGERGRVYAVGLDHGHAVLLSVLRAFKDRPKASARRLAVGDVIPDIPGDEIVVADDGTVGDALVRVFDSQTQRVVAEFEAFAPGAAPAGVELWVGDVLTAFPGAELLVGEGPAGGRVSVFTVASGVPLHVLDVPDPLNRATSLHGHLAIGNLLPELDGNEIAVAQGDPRIPVQIFNLNTGLNDPAATVQPASDMDTVTAVATTY